jgi:hypothetical protein
MMDIYYLTEKEITDLALDNLTVGASIGLLIGVVLAIAFVYFIIRTNERNFKMWYLQLQDEEKINIKNKLDATYENLEYLARTSNTRYFKTSFNDYNRLIRYLKEKWKQN